MPCVAQSKPSHIVLIRLMSFMPVPLACWQLWIFPFIPYYQLQDLFAYPVCLYFCWLIALGHIHLANMFQRWRPLIPLALLIMLLQSIALWQNTPLPDHCQRLFPRTGGLWDRCTLLLALWRQARHSDCVVGTLELQSIFWAALLAPRKAIGWLHKDLQGYSAQKSWLFRQIYLGLFAWCARRCRHVARVKCCKTALAAPWCL